MRLLLLNQSFPPDVVSTAQHAGDLARGLVAQGHHVTVLASQRAYDNPSLRFAPHEMWDGVRILRVLCSGFGKTAKWRRVTDFATFLASCFVHLMQLPRFDVLVAMTTPPFLSLLAATCARLRREHLVVWVMDLNPDEAIAAGWLRERSFVARILHRLMRHSFQAADRIMVLDRFMKDRIVAKGILEKKIAVIPPWSHDAAIRYDPEGRARFRHAHGLQDKFVVMYSGNHSPCHPLDTLLDAAARLAHRKDIAFCFVGGGSEFGKVRQFAQDHRLPNIVCLPYQPLQQLSASLSAADLHVVVMGDPFVGIVHPCKIYNILALGIPFLYIGPQPSHVTEMLPVDSLGDWARLAGHGDVEAVVNHILWSALAGSRRSEAQVRLAAMFSQQALIPEFISFLETAAQPQQASSGSPSRVSATSASPS